MVFPVGSLVRKLNAVGLVGDDLAVQGEEAVLRDHEDTYHVSAWIEAHAGDRAQ